MLDGTQLRFAGFWIRFVAWLTDIILFVVVASVLSAAISSIAWAIALVGFIVYSAALEGSSLRATLGKHIVGIGVTDLEGNRLSWSRASGRALAKLVSSAVFPLGHLIAALSDNKQSLHDLLATTVVVERPSPR